MQDIGYSGEATIVSKVAERVSGSASVDVVYRESRVVGDKTIIPVAKVEYVFGAGSGGGVGPSRDNGANIARGGGGGGGGAVRVRPIGVLEVSGDETRMVAVLDWTRIVTTAIVAGGLLMVVRAIFRRR